MWPWAPRHRPHAAQHPFPDRRPPRAWRNDRTNRPSRAPPSSVPPPHHQPNRCPHRPWRNDPAIPPPLPRLDSPAAPYRQSMRRHAPDPHHFCTLSRPGPGTCARLLPALCVVRCALEQVAQRYDLRLMSFDALNRPAHRAMNPFGQIQTMKTALSPCSNPAPPCCIWPIGTPAFCPPTRSRAPALSAESLPRGPPSKPRSYSYRWPR